jgi:hypothetical protein
MLLWCFCHDSTYFDIHYFFEGKWWNFCFSKSYWHDFNNDMFPTNNCSWIRFWNQKALGFSIYAEVNELECISGWSCKDIFHNFYNRYFNVNLTECFFLITFSLFRWILSFDGFWQSRFSMRVLKKLADCILSLNASSQTSILMSLFTTACLVIEPTQTLFWKKTFLKAAWWNTWNVSILQRGFWVMTVNNPTPTSWLILVDFMIRQILNS